MKITIATAVLLISTAATSLCFAGEQNASACTGATQFELNTCAGNKFKTADKLMNDKYKLLVSKLSARDKTRLRDAQRTWVAFRDKACLFEAGTKEESGSSWIQDHQSCLAYHTIKRTDDLKNISNLKISS